MLFTIGFTKKSAAHFFGLLRSTGTKRVLDVRTNNISQLAGFAKKEDLSYFLREILNVEYIEVRDLAPDAPLLKSYRNGEISWQVYSDKYLDSLARRRVESVVDRSMFDHGCLLCSEHEPHYCHRTLAAQYLNDHWNDRLKVRHLV